MFINLWDLALHFNDLFDTFNRRLKSCVRSFFRYFGFELIFYNPSSSSHAQEQAFFKHLNICSVLDVGANSGEFALSLRDGGFTGNIISIEPLSSAHQKLVIRSRRDPRWTVVPRCAVGNFSGSIDINISRNSASSSILGMNLIHTQAEPNSVYVSSETCNIALLDDLILDYSFPLPLLIKIDVQGYELQVLEGSSKALAIADGVLIELSLVAVYEGQALWLEVVDFLKGHDFVLWGLYNGFTDPNSGQSLQINALFKKCV